MTWFKVDDQLHAHPKWRAATPQAKALWVTAGSYCGAYKTNGIVNSTDLPLIAVECGMSLARTRKAAGELVDAELWTTPADKVWQFHNWVQFNPAREQVDRTAAEERERKKLHRDPDLKSAIRLRDDDRCRYCGVRVNFAARTGHQAGRYDHVKPIVQGGKTVLDNLVVACDYHNRLKGARTPDEADMPLLDPGTKTPEETPDN